MLRFFREFFKSKFGAVIALGVLILIALAFTSGDVASSGAFGGVSGGDRVATVGNERIDTSTLSQAASTALDRVREDDPTMSMKGFLANGGLEDVLDEMINRTAIAVFGQKQGIVASDRLVDSEIATMPVFQGADGRFSQDIFRQMMVQRGISESVLRDDLRQGLIARQVMLPAAFGAVMPRELASRYATLLSETREGSIAVLPSLAFAPEKEPTNEELAAFYKANQGEFIRPERRVIRYAAFDGEQIAKAPAAATDAEIAARYGADKAKYAAREKRRVSQVIAPTEAAAQAIAAEAAKGGTLETVAKSKGLAVAGLEFFDKADLSRQFSPDVANAAFAAEAGKLAKPARSALGWHVVRVDEIDRQAARALADVRAELAREISVEKHKAALNEMLEKIETEFESGSSLPDVAREFGLEATRTKPVTADGKVYLTRDERVPSVLDKVLETAFVMDTDDPQVAMIDEGKFVIFDVTEIAPSAPAPLKEITDNVKAAYMLDKGAAAARAAAEKVQAQVRKGSSLAEAMASLKKSLPPVQPIRMTRPELVQIQQQGQQVPPALALMFSMADGTTKVQPGPGRRAWFVVSLDAIKPGKVEDDQMIASAQRELGVVVGNEYGQALQRAIRSQIGVKHNPAGIRSVRDQLGGGS